MIARTVTFLMVVAALAGTACLADSAGLPFAAAAVGDPAELTAADQLVAAVHPTALTPPAASQPEPRAGQPGVPTTQAQGSQISFILTRSLPDSLVAKHFLAMSKLTPADRQLVEIRSILQESQVTLEALIKAKKEFDKLPAERQDYYRKRAQEIQQVLSTLPKEELAHLATLNAKERAKRLMELVAQMKAKQARDAANPPANPTGSGPPTSPK